MKKHFGLSLAVLIAMGGGIHAEEIADNNSPQVSNQTDSNQTSNNNSNIKEVDIGRSVVTASGYEQDIKDAPASMTIITQEELLNRPIRDLGDALQEVPGVATEISKTGGSSIQMRGLSSGYTLILIDGKKQNVNGSFGGNGFDPTSGFMPPASMIERIEVIRGPASVIYGSDAMGGVINIITKKMPDKVSGSIALETRLQQHTRNWGNSYGFNGYIATPLIDKVLSLNVRGKYNKSEQNSFYKADIPGYNNTNGNPYTSHSPTGYINASVGGRLDWIIDSQNSIYLDHEFNYQQLGSLNTSSSQITAVRDYKKYNTILNHDGKYAWGSLTSYIQFADTQQIPHISGNTGNYGNTHLPQNRGSLQDNMNLIVNSTWKDSYDFNNAGALLAQAGLYYAYESFESRSSNYKNHFNQAAIFGEVEYLPMDLISTTLGLRLNYTEFTSITANPRLYVNVNPTEWFTIKAGVSSGMKVPQLSYLYEGETLTSSGSTTTATYGNKDLKAEQTWNYELSTIFDTPIAYITLTGFYTDFKNAVNSVSYNSGVSIPNIGACGYSTCILYENTDKALSTGAEVALNLKRIYGFGLDATYAFTYTKQMSGANKGAPLNAIPRHNGSVKLSYNYEDFDIYLRWTGKFRTPSSTSHTANTGIGGWFKDIHLLDLGMSYRFRDTYTLSFVVNNLLDTNFLRYVTYMNGSTQRYTNLYQRMLPGRNFWISLKADF